MTMTSRIGILKLLIQKLQSKASTITEAKVNSQFHRNQFSNHMHYSFQHVSSSTFIVMLTSLVQFLHFISKRKRGLSSGQRQLELEKERQRERQTRHLLEVFPPLFPLQVQTLWRLFPPQVQTFHRKCRLYGGEVNQSINYHLLLRHLDLLHLLLLSSSFWLFNQNKVFFSLQ